MRLYGLILLAVAFIASSCGDGSDLPSHGGSGGSIIGGGGGSGTPAVTVVASPASISVSGTSTVTATVLDSSGALVADGTPVSFSLSPALGTITASANTSNGIATATYTASTTPGSVTVTATSGSNSNTDTITIFTQAATVTLTAAPSTISVFGTSSLSATVLDTTGANMPDGTIVTFALSAPAMGTINAQATTSSGIATVTFVSSNIPGTVTVTATSGSVSNTASITITAPEAGSIEFTSATPQVLGLRGFGQTETSLVQFTVNDINGNPISDGTSVDFVMSGPGGGRTPDNGGEYIGIRDDGTPTTETVSTVNGIASVFLHSGTLAGTVTIDGTVTITGPPMVTISSSSAVMSIGGGVPSATHFSIATTQFNLAGYTDRGSLGFINDTAEISAFVADRFGNFNVLQGTSLSFYTEAGAIDTSGTVDDTGATSVTFRTQNPMPEDVLENASETALKGSIDAIWGIPAAMSTYHPRDGRLTVFATVMGEESYDDANANGIFDPVELFVDADEPFYDNNDDGCRNDGTTAFCPDGSTPASTDPFEIFIDANNNGQYDIPNSCWDGPNPNPAYVCAGREDSKMIYQRIDLMFTGNPVFIDFNPTGFAIPNGGSQVFNIIIADVNLNTPIGGTTISVSKAGTGGKLIAFVPSPIADGTSSGPLTFNVTIEDGDVEAPNIVNPENATLAVEVTWKGVKYFSTISGTVD
jgi:hypothetical protein